MIASRPSRPVLGWLVVAALAVLGVIAPAGVAGAQEPPRAVVLVGAPGLSWTDIDAVTTPTLHGLALAGGVASLTVRAVRSRSCAVDGWLTLSAGRRAADLVGPCRAPQGVAADGAVPHWEDYLTAADADSYGAVPGTLASSLLDAGTCVGAVGPGAAIGAADVTGRTATSTLPDGAVGCRVTLVDGGILPVDPVARTAALRALDTTTAQVLGAADPRTRIVVAGVGDGLSAVRPRALIITGDHSGWLTSPSTRQPGLVQLQDLTATLLDWEGASASELTGRPVTVTADGGPASDRIAELQGFEVRSSTLRSVSPQVTGWLAAAFAAWCFVAGVVLRRRGVISGRVTLAGVAVASVPLSTFAANLVPWWRAPAPALAFVAVLAAVVAVVTTLAALARRRWHLGALVVLSVLTLLVLGGDVLTGSGLQLASVFGQNPTVGGRFYGVGNTSYALYGVALLGVVGVLATARARTPHRSLALSALVLLAAIVIEGAPSLGADFGGPPGLLLGGLVVLAGSSGVRLTPRRVLGALVGVAAVTTVVAVLDWLRAPAARTHLGEFVETVLHGDLADVIGRKVSQNLANLTSPPLLTVSVAALALVLLARHTGWRPSSAGSLVLRGSAVLAAVGFAVNDSGLVIPAYAALMLLPLLAADTAARHLAATPLRGVEGRGRGVSAR
ncbi:MAG: hypothetical protein ABIQ61_04105 [Ornithinibacter sp.]